MHFSYSQSQSMSDGLGPDFNEFEAELPGYYEDRNRPVTNRPRGRLLSFNGPARDRTRTTVRGTLPHHYSGVIRNKYSIPAQNNAREEQLQQRVHGVKEKLELLEQMSSGQLTKRMEMLVEFSIQEMEKGRPQENLIGQVRGLQQRLGQSQQVTYSQDIEEEYRELEKQDMQVEELKTTIDTRQRDIEERITRSLCQFKTSSDGKL